MIVGAAPAVLLEISGWFDDSRSLRIERLFMGLRFRRPNTAFANALAANELQPHAEERAALWECAEAADRHHTSQLDSIDRLQLHAIATAWSTLTAEVRAAIVAIVRSVTPRAELPMLHDRAEQSD